MFDEAFNKGNTDPIYELIAADYIDHSPIPAPAPGPHGFAKRTAALRAAFVQEAEFGVFLAEGGLVAFTWTFNGVHNGPFAGIPATGKMSLWLASTWKDSKTGRSSSTGVILI